MSRRSVPVSLPIDDLVTNSKNRLLANASHDSVEFVLSTRQMETKIELNFPKSPVQLELYSR